MEQWIMDLRFAARRIIRRPMYSVLTCLTLALGIGGSAAAFGIARNVLLESLPYTNDEGIGVLWFPYSWTQEEFAFLRGRFPGFCFHERLARRLIHPLDPLKALQTSAAQR